MDRPDHPLPLEGLPLLLAAAVIAMLALGLAVQLAKPPAKGPVGSGTSAELTQTERLRLAEQSAAARERLLVAR